MTQLSRSDRLRRDSCLSRLLQLCLLGQVFVQDRAIAASRPVLLELPIENF